MIIKNIGKGDKAMKTKLVTRLSALAAALALALALGISLTPAGFNNMVINTVAKASNSK